jgi:hypothetical protein
LVLWSQGRCFQGYSREDWSPHLHAVSRKRLEQRLEVSIVHSPYHLTWSSSARIPGIRLWTCPPGVEEALESEHRAHAAFYPSVILFDNVVQVGTVSNLDVTVPTIIELVIHTHAAQSPMTRFKTV